MMEKWEKKGLPANLLGEASGEGGDEKRRRKKERFMN